jgi:hypothetical protein
MFDDMEEGLEWFAKPPSFNDLCVRLNAKFGSDFTMKGRFDSGKTRAHYDIMPLQTLLTSPATLGSSKVRMYLHLRWLWRMGTCWGFHDGPCNYGVGGDEEEFGVEEDGTQDNMDLDGMPYDSWGRISEAQQYVPSPPYTEIEFMQLRQGGVPFSGVPNYRDVSIIDMTVCDTGLQMCRQSLYNPEDEILRKGMIFNTMSEMKLFL